MDEPAGKRNKHCCASISPVDVYNSPLHEYSTILVHCAAASAPPIPNAFVPQCTDPASIQEEVHVYGENYISSRYLQLGVVIYNDSGEDGGLAHDLAALLLQDNARSFKSVKIMEGGLQSFCETFPGLCEAYAKRTSPDQFVPFPSRICDHLYLSGASCVLPVVLQGLNIEAILNAGGSRNGTVTEHITNYLFLNFEDSTTVQLEPYIAEAIPFIKQHVDAGRNVLVHCQAGVSRSVSLVVAYLMITQCLSFAAALDYIRGVRSMARPNWAFAQQLKAMQTQSMIEQSYTIDFKIHLRDINPHLVEYWKDKFSEHNLKVTVSCGDIFEAAVQGVTAIVSPANSFGFMDGGIDMAYSLRFGWGLQARLQKVLAEEWWGELPVGCAVIVPTEDSVFHHCVSAPTMRVPEKVENTPNAYLAFRAALIEVQRYNQKHDTGKVETILCPGLGTAIGRMPVERCAEQMKRAFESVCVRGYPKNFTPDTLFSVANEHEEMCHCGEESQTFDEVASNSSCKQT